MHNPFVHIELHTDDVAGAQKFYKQLFSWKFPPMGPTYTGVDVGEGTGGGIQKKMMAAAPTMWLPYVLVESVKKTTAKAAKLGATVMVDYMPIEGMGALGVFVDPNGAAIGVWEAGKMESSPKKPSVKKSAKKAAKKSSTKTQAAKKAAPKKGATPKKKAAKKSR